MNSIFWAFKGQAFYQVWVGAALGHMGQSDGDAAGWYKVLGMFLHWAPEGGEKADLS